jgi:hypothetical protein
MMNEIYEYSSRAFFIAFLQICMVLAASSCDRDSTEGEECTEIGETEDCDDESGNPGFRLCLPDGVFTECVYQIPKAGQPCSDLGETYACACDGRLNGIMYCLKEDHSYSECFCESGSTSPIAPVGTGGEDSVSEDSTSCPASFSCQEQAQAGTVNKLCVKNAIPPLCESNDDCDSEGLEEAQCLDIGVGTKVCLQTCE